MEYLFVAIDNHERKAARNPRPAPARVETAGVGLLPAAELTGQPIIWTVVMSDEYRAWQEDTTDATPYPLRHSYEAIGQYWLRFCDGEPFETLGCRMDPDRFDRCPICENAANATAAAWIDRRAQWGE